MPIIFISLNESFIKKVQEHRFEAKCMKIEEYIPNTTKETYYVSPANSLCFMDGGIDFVLSRIIFPEIEPFIKKVVQGIGIRNLLGRNYLPIGSSIIIENKKHPNRSLVISPTMLLPQNVSGTKNAYYCTMAILYNILINKNKKMDTIDIIFTSFCCGYGQMSEEESIEQILQGIQDYKSYQPKYTCENIVINEPNLYEQPKYYQNSEFFEIQPQELKKC